MSVQFSSVTLLCTCLK